ncbi:MAG: hypothetical protein ABFC88_12865 [Thermoguttaceae bacterium]
MDSNTLADLLLLLKQYGPLILVVAFFLWQGWVREGRMSKRITGLEDEQRNVLMPLVERCADVIAQNTMMMERLEKALDERFECPLRNQCPQR